VENDIDEAFTGSLRHIWRVVKHIPGNANPFFVVFEMSIVDILRMHLAMELYPYVWLQDNESVKLFCATN
jgi:hypothetical protein